MLESSTGPLEDEAADNVTEWTVEQVGEWTLNLQWLPGSVWRTCLSPWIQREHINGKALLLLSEKDLLTCENLPIGHRKNLLVEIRQLHRNSNNYATLDYLSLVEHHPQSHHHHHMVDHHHHNNSSHHNHHHDLINSGSTGGVCGGVNCGPGGGGAGGGGFGGSGHGGSGGEIDRISPASSTIGVGGRATSIKPEVFKTFVSVAYAFLVTWITAFVMVIVHERVPDMKRYPPLPDIFLDNVPHIPWAFNMCEITGTVLFAIWVFVLIVHRHRIVLLRRFFALGGTVFLLRCVTMLITSLSVPGTHLQCTSDDHKLSEDSAITVAEAISLRVQRAYTIWSGLGMSIQGVRTCGDYMFSGHTVSLTLLNFFITEYTPRRLYFLHTITWLLNMFGIFFILAAHEHYSIDVFVAFYISSRLFLYYHTLSNNDALHMNHDSNRTRVWFPMFSYFENSVYGIIPNEYDTLGDVMRGCGGLVGEMLWGLVTLKDMFMLTARRTNLERSIKAKIAASRKNSGNNNDTTLRDLNSTSSARTTPLQSPSGEKLGVAGTVATEGSNKKDF